MRKLSEIKNEDALDVLVNILDPVTEIFTDKKFETEWKKDVKGAIKYVIGAHKKAVIELLAGIEGVPVNEFEISLIQIPMRLFDLFNDADTLDFFESQGLKISDISFGSAMGNTRETETK